MTLSSSAGPVQVRAGWPAWVQLKIQQVQIESASDNKPRTRFLTTIPIPRSILPSGADNNREEFLHWRVREDRTIRFSLNVMIGNRHEQGTPAVGQGSSSRISPDTYSCHDR